MRKSLTLLLLLGSFLVTGTSAIAAEKPEKPEKPVRFPEGCCYYEGEIVRTVIPPVKFAGLGIDPFFGFPAVAADGQKAIVGVAPGDVDYHGGMWAFYAVVWNGTTPPRLLTSEADVDDAESVGDVTVTRVESEDFICPIQP